MASFNSIAGAAIASVLGVMVIGLGAQSLFHTSYPEKAGFAPDATFDTAGGGPATPAGPPDFGRVFADEAQLADLVARGQRAVGVCASCHAFEEAAGNKTGPNLHDVFGRPAHAHPGFDYSPGMQGHNVTWSYLTLNEFLTSPSVAVPGTKMAFAGLRRPEDRMAVIAYLRSISPHSEPLPAPLPETPAAPAEGGATPAAEGATTPATQTPNPPTSNALSQPGAAQTTTATKTGH